MNNKVPRDELKSRMDRFRAGMNKSHPGWEMAAIFGKVNLYYFTGTMQDGVLLIPSNSDAVFWVRRSCERAVAESQFPDIRQMRSYRDAATATDDLPQTIFVETELVTLGLIERFRKHFGFIDVKSLDYVLGMVRAQKSDYEISLMEKSGKIHRRVLEERVPEIVSEGMSELDFALKLYSLMMEEGHHGVARFGMFDTEILVGQIGFGESSIYPTCFNGPGGAAGLGPAVPLLGSRERKLKHGDLIFADTGSGFHGYHTDKTMTYTFKEPLSEDAVESHNGCLEVQDRIASMLRPGAVPSEIYRDVMESLNKDFLKNFMGYGDRTVNFLGHGVGLLVDEIPVIAAGFDEPLVENMVFALEPKKGVKGVGMVGVENTFVVTPSGGRCITGTHPGLMLIE
ncbi:peptidase M24 [Methanolacinia petrolearia DSM 11571]|uniref:Peptidase M24 n=1 Tax=Methanolacinia petrolearia (strain DSM 11571 / OCM 486 / SEBR 4847) TaxID=679926 RepID=E1RD57_METP4|nr:Xaa-Pro peptidase family protein [Methanolacinia petrolearia]ADN37040.1 peptidase M24 [Methanolacinia petrolearia DSM 11571]